MVFIANHMYFQHAASHFYLQNINTSFSICIITDDVRCSEVSLVSLMSDVDAKLSPRIVWISIGILQTCKIINQNLKCRGTYSELKGI